MLNSNKICISANKDEAAKAIDSIVEFILANGADRKTASRIQIALEEVLVNVASYAYQDKRGNIEIEYEIVFDPIKTLKVTIIDSGMAFDPLAKEDPDIVSFYEQKKIGGLGIYMTKQIMDEVVYQRKDNKNILVLKKTIDPVA